MDRKHCIFWQRHFASRPGSIVSTTKKFLVSAHATSTARIPREYLSICQYQGSLFAWYLVSFPVGAALHLNSSGEMSFEVFGGSQGYE
jgi:hypothetical protein